MAFGTTDSYSTEPGELEHWTGKSRYKRTSKKTCTEQLTHIERREAHICLMHQKLGMSSEDCAVATDQEASTLDNHHHIGSLKTHLCTSHSSPKCTPAIQLARILYQTSRLTYITAFTTQTLEIDSGWYKLNMLHFVPMAEDDAFGFVNPANVLQSGHLVPAFHKGKLHPNGIGMSKFAQDAQDWKKYYVNWSQLCLTLKKPTNMFLTDLGSFYNGLLHNPGFWIAILQIYWPYQFISISTISRQMVSSTVPKPKMTVL
ncbi:hypothetical protein SERLADRAFT_405837 [Serpula lacrymans var. lacrymans S7.9]|uniref:Uncharacterized protein n=1 Tax=Serpula lacrymans var. lacrymans (strain S7.9) TaxID=578457 RepID=F8NLL0_SERL9|nr:uncharacterized protein SERLADRAFT_405837 [Serpula lacrymans var. lacrymans S7.9]EGO28191.1 hypothetical protein SERLADRAFT_405837 [Serpula lacrymans var. lacrymans S7.9]